LPMTPSTIRLQKDLWKVSHRIYASLHFPFVILMSIESWQCTSDNPIIVFDDLWEQSDIDAGPILVRYRQPSFSFLGDRVIPKGFRSLSDFVKSRNPAKCQSTFPSADLLESDPRQYWSDRRWARSCLNRHRNFTSISGPRTPPLHHGLSKSLIWNVCESCNPRFEYSQPKSSNSYRLAFLLGSCFIRTENQMNSLM
jgi:hypothetical protein